MKYGFVLPWGDAAVAADLAVEAERAGWDGFFVWEAIWGTDAWMSLAAAAVRTGTIRLGTMLTPLPRRKPWDVASQAATLDRLSGGRAILSVGLGAIDDRWWIFEDDPGRAVRAGMLDEGLRMLEPLWRAEPFRFDGSFYRAVPADRAIPAAPVQQPRIPVWVVGLWPSPRSMRRVARWDGWLPNARGADGTPGRPSVEQVEAAVSWLRAERARQDLPWSGFDIIVEGTTRPGPHGGAEVVAWARAGATWWIEADWSLEGPDAVAASRDRLRAGPPRG
jgi:alkanesulfonate monooxygenase SsuD/methylene tetrahydromethanopterin reductase-like flavin-dependent oxidoreductase (luciferase family)